MLPLETSQEQQSANTSSNYHHQQQQQPHHFHHHIHNHNSQVARSLKKSIKIVDIPFVYAGQTSGTAQNREDTYCVRLDYEKYAPLNTSSGSNQGVVEEEPATTTNKQPSNEFWTGASYKSHAHKIFSHDGLNTTGEKLNCSVVVVGGGDGQQTVNSTSGPTQLSQPFRSLSFDNHDHCLPQQPRMTTSLNENTAMIDGERGHKEEEEEEEEDVGQNIERHFGFKPIDQIENENDEIESDVYPEIAKIDEALEEKNTTTTTKVGFC